MCSSSSRSFAHSGAVEEARSPWPSCQRCVVGSPAMDPTNPIIQLCVQGVEAESARRFDEARTYFEQAWRAATDDVEACIAAHYIARNQSDLEQALWWNQIALARADKVADDRVRSFYSSLHLNLA